MKKQFYLSVVAICFCLAIAPSSCVDNYDITQVEPKNYDADYRSAGWGSFPTMINSINELTSSWQFQVQEYLNAGIFSQMYMSASGGAYGVQPNNTQLAMTSGWNAYVASVPYGTVMSSWLSVKAVSKSYPEFLAIANVIKVVAMHKVVDAFGPTQYIHYGEATSGVPYDTVSAIYHYMIQELTTADSVIAKYLSLGKPKVIVVLAGGADAIYKGDVEKWRKLANSLKLRLAMRMSMKDDASAKTFVKQAVDAGVILDNADNALIDIGGYTNPYSTYANSWGEMRMSALAESILVGYNDPRLPLLFKKSTDPDPAFVDKYKGIRLGVTKTGVSGYGGFSAYAVEAKTPIRLFSAAESHFLMAEAQLRGLMGTESEAKASYEKGIQASMQEYGIKEDAITAYTGESVAKPIDYVDLKDPKNNASATTDVTIKWDDGDSKDRKMEKIITQKWIALIPSGAEGWAEYRRTGYPKLFTSVTVTDKNMDSTGPRRLPYTSYHQGNSADKTQLDKAIASELGGNDFANERLWWDVPDANKKIK